MCTARGSGAKHSQRASVCAQCAGAVSDVRICAVQNYTAEAPCHVLYHYHWHERLGWMYARLQTWFPFHIQIGLNGREWLAQQMRQQGLKFQQEKNCFTHLEDFARAQQLMNQQLQTDWVDLLTGLARQLNPLHEEIFARYPT